MSKLQQSSVVEWESELNATSYRYHVMVSWAAALLNPIFIIGDYFIKPDFVLNFFVFRVAVSLIIATGLLLKEKFKNQPHILGLLPYWGISIQNAYMYSVMNVEELQQHTFSYIVLFIGAGLFLLWRVLYSILSVIASIAVLVVLFVINSELTFQELLTNGGMLTITVAILTIPLIYTRTNLTKKEIISRLALAESNKQLEIKNQIIEEKSKDIQDSINYSKGIQDAILPPLKKIDGLLKDYFILYTPKDVVSGDFYWCTSVKTTPKEGAQEDVVLIAAVDCTGHGVPGAMMSVIGNAILNQSIKAVDVNTPADALNFLNRELAKNLNAIKDGMDMSLVAINMEKLELQYAGANNPIYIIRNKELIQLFPDKMPIGGNLDDFQAKDFNNHVFKLEKGDAVYLFTDGYVDQFGGPKGKKFKYRQFQDLLISIQDKNMKEQRGIIHSAHQNWKGDLIQVDDILVIGIRI